MSRMERIASRCRTGTGGDVSANARTASGGGGVGWIAITAGVARRASAQVGVAVSLTDGDSEQAMVVQQSLRSVDNPAVVSDAREQHGIRVQKPMIAEAGASAAISRTTSSASDLRFMFGIPSDAPRVRKNSGSRHRLRRIHRTSAVLSYGEPSIGKVEVVPLPPERQKKNLSNRYI